MLKLSYDKFNRTERPTKRTRMASKIFTAYLWWKHVLPTKRRRVRCYLQKVDCAIQFRYVRIFTRTYYAIIFHALITNFTGMTAISSCILLIVRLIDY